MTVDQSEQESLPRRQTDPAWLQDHFLGTGDNETTRNATVTFVKRKGLHYAVTCRHVTAALSDPQIVPAARNPTIALHVGRAVLNLSYFTARGLASGILSPKAETVRDEVDVAIAPLDGGHWALLARDKNKVPIDIDAWSEPDWPLVKYCVATGYPDKHKKRVTVVTGEKVASKLVMAVAEATSHLGRSERLIALSSTLEQPHGFYFSGMSGGPVYAIEGHEQREVEDDQLFPIGIVFEGFPGGGSTVSQTPGTAMGAFLTDNDLFFRALMLTPEIFDEWWLKTQS